MEKKSSSSGKIKNVLLVFAVGAVVGLLLGWILLGIIFDMLGLWFLWDIRLIIGAVLGMIIIPVAYFTTVAQNGPEKKAEESAPAAGEADSK